MEIEIKPQLKELRQTRQISQEELAEHLGVSRQTIFALEQGLSDPSLTLACKIAEFFDRQVEEVFFGEAHVQLVPFRGIRDLHEEIDRFFDETVQTLPAAANQVSAPAVNLHQDNKNVYVEFAVPGFSTDEIDTEITEKYLTVRGTKHEESEEKGKIWLRREFGATSFERSISLPQGVKVDKAQANLKDGKLSIILPKAEPTKPKTTKLKIKAS
ncbi:MAG: Hsp20 family protein [Patescibacteria group bacterium]